MARGLVLLVVVLLSSPVSADIVAWDDAAGVRHYTNLRDLVPEAYRGSAHVIVEEAARPVTSAAAAADAQADDTTQRAERSPTGGPDREALARAYIEGLERGLAAAGGEGDAAPVIFNGPLAVAVTTPTTAPAVYAPWVPYLPLVTSSFDRGRSRHLTLRLLLQDQFAIDREGPYTYIGRMPPLGVNLPPFLPRGLPYGPDRYNRVLIR